MQNAILQLFEGSAFGVGLTAALMAIAWFGRALIGQFFIVAGDQFRSALRIDETRYDQTLKAALDFKSRQLTEFYWPIYIRLQKDNAVWDRILDRYKNDEMLRKVAFDIEKNEILPNHDQIVQTIQAKIHLAQAEPKLQAALMRYIRHVAVYKAMRNTGVTDRDPIALDEPWPKGLFELVEKKTEALQSDYDFLLKSAGLGKPVRAATLNEDRH
jgi:hypothetical protein